MASFCIASGIQPSEYKKLTIAEYRALVELIDKANR
jgi:hypothetical protein